MRYTNPRLLYFTLLINDQKWSPLAIVGARGEVGCEICEVILYVAAPIWRRLEFPVESCCLVSGTISLKMNRSSSVRWR